MSDHTAAAHQVLARLPSGRFVLSAAHEGRRTGVAARSVQWGATDPMLLIVSVRCGHWIDTLIRDSHVFGVSSLEPTDALAEHKFLHAARPRDTDPFEALDVTRLSKGVPVLARSRWAVECAVYRHIDLEADHQLYVGLVVSGRLLSSHEPDISFQIDYPTEWVVPDRPPRVRARSARRSIGL